MATQAVSSNGATGSASIETMALTGEVVDAYVEVPGTESQMNFDVAFQGFAVTASALVLKVPAALTRLPVTGQFQDGDEVRVEFVGKVSHVHFDPIEDRYGNRIGVTRRHLVPVSKWRLVENTK